jgi:hypothetical protein
MGGQSGDTDNAAAGGLLVGGSALTVLVIGLLMGLAPFVLVPAVAASAAAGGLVAFMASAGQRRDMRRWQEAAVALSAWTARNAGQSAANPAAFTGEWTLPASPRFAGAILGVGRVEGYEVGVSCYTQPDGDGIGRHTSILVRLRHEHPPVRARWRFRGRFAEPVARKLAELAICVELVEVEHRELRIFHSGWPEALDLEACVDGAVEVARALDKRDAE